MDAERKRDDVCVEVGLDNTEATRPDDGSRVDTRVDIRFFLSPSTL